MSSNRTRARRAARTLTHYAFISDVETSIEAVTDLVADIGHYCVENDLTYLYLLARGIGHWRLEMTDPDCIEPLPEVSITINESKSHV